jgi:hypothetical protein
VSVPVVNTGTYWLHFCPQVFPPSSFVCIFYIPAEANLRKQLGRYERLSHSQRESLFIFLQSLPRNQLPYAPCCMPAARTAHLHHTKSFFSTSKNPTSLLPHLPHLPHLHTPHTPHTTHHTGPQGLHAPEPDRRHPPYAGHGHALHPLLSLRLLGRRRRVLSCRLCRLRSSHSLRRLRTCLCLSRIYHRTHHNRTQHHPSTYRSLCFW